MNECNLNFEGGLFLFNILYRLTSTVGINMSLGRDPYSGGKKENHSFSGKITCKHAVRKKPQ